MVRRESPPTGEWPKHQLESVPACPLCGHHERTVLQDQLRDTLFGRAPGRWTMHRCAICGAGYLDPRPDIASIGRAYGGYYTHAQTPSERTPRRWKLALRNGYLNSHYGYAAQPATRMPVALLPARLRRKAARSVRHLPHPGGNRPRLLDLGCGNGAFLSDMRELGWDGVGLEPDGEAVRSARRIGLAVEVGVLTESSFPAESFDAITMNHVIEHLHDPARMLRLCHRVLRPSGLLWIATPNLDSLGLALFGPCWRGLEPPRHLVMFTFDALRAALRRAGFEPAPAALPGMGARWMFRASARIGSGDKPLSPCARLRLKWQAQRADRRARRQPYLAEEIVLLSRKR